MKRNILAVLFMLGLVAFGALTWMYLERSRAQPVQDAAQHVTKPAGEDPEVAAAQLVAPREPDAEPGLTRPETADRSAIAESPTAAAAPPAGTRPLQGHVRLPAGTPADERLVVLAVDRKMTLRELEDSPGAVRMCWDPRIQRTKALVATAEVAPDGSFRLDLPEGARAAHLALAGRYVFSMATTEVALPAAGALTLTGELGAWVTGQLLPPPDPTPLQSDFDWIEVELGPDLTGGFDAMGMASIGVTRKTEAASDGAFEFRGIPEAGVYGISVEHGHLAALLQLGIDPAPGEHLELAVQMLRGATLRGTVVDGNGAPVADAEVHARHRGLLADAIGALRTGHSDADGAFELEHVAVGHVDLRAERSGYQRGSLKLEDELRDGQVLGGLELVLEFGASISGRALYPDGQPVAGAAVIASPDLSRAIGSLNAMDAVRAQGGTTEADEDGRFELTGLSETFFLVNATLGVPEGEHAGAWRATVKGIAPGGEPVELTLRRLVQLEGRVVDLEDEPIVEFNVRATKQGSGAMFGIGAEVRTQSFSDEEGRFVLTDLTQDVWELEVSAEGRATSELQEVPLPRADGAPELLFVLAPAAGVSGIVLDTEARPVSGAKVTLELDLGARVAAMSAAGIPEIHTDSDGHFLLQNLEPGAIALVASHEGFAGSEPLSCELVSGTVTEDVVLHLRVGGGLTGIVYDDAGDPAAGRMVIVQKTPSYSAQHMLTSDARGEFAVEHLEPGKWQVVATANFMSGEMGDDDIDMGQFLGDMKMGMAEIVDGETTHVVLGAPPADPVQLSGRVTHAAAPVVGAMISMVPEDTEGAGLLSALKMKITDGDGRFEIQLDHPGAYLVTVQTGVSMGNQNSVEFLERIPEDAEAHELAIELPGGRISGRVLGPDGHPLADCRVTMTVEGGIAYGSFTGGNYVEMQTGDDGSYDANYLRPGSYSVAAGGVPLAGLFGDEQSKAGRAIRSGVKLDEGEWLDSIDFRLSEPGELSGVVLETSGAPVPGASVFVRDEDGRLLERFSLITTDGTGHFTYGGLAPGRYSASARMPGRASAESSPANVSEGEHAEVRLTLIDGTLLRVVVSDETGAEVRAKISVTDSSGRELAGMLSMSEIMESYGSGFSAEEQRIGPLPEGKYKVTATMEDGRRSTKTVSLHGQGERKVKLRL